jgi:nitrite reductase/ring-hydroxylating ferredoxin subunit
MAGEIPAGGVRAISLGGRALILSRSDAAVTCFDDRCVHLGASLHGGVAGDGVLTCPSHGFRYDLRTGDCVTSPGLSLVANETLVVEGRVLVRLAG